MNAANDGTSRTTGTVSALERVLLAVCVIAFLIAMLVIAVLFPEVTAFQEWVFRTILSLAAGAAAAFIPGFFHLKIGQGGIFAVRAGGAIAVFAFVFYVNPPSLVSERKVFIHEGLVKNLESHISSSDTSFTLILKPERIDELRSLYIDETVGRDWGELFSKMCRRYPGCLSCDPEPGNISDRVTLSLIGPPLINHPDTDSGNVKQCQPS